MIRLSLLALLILTQIPLIQGQQYHWDRPDHLWELPGELLEISGLTFAPEDRWLLAVQDEWGTIYGIDPENGQLAKTWPFLEKGDFEGIAMVDSTLWVLRSDGRLFSGTWQDGPSTAPSPVKTGLPKGIDVEGLAWNPNTQRLLLAVKDEPDRPARGPAGVYPFSFYSAQTDSLFLQIDQESFTRMIARLPRKSGKKRVRQWLDSQTDTFLLGPSGIAVHPLTGEYYMISSRGKVLMIFDVQGECREIIPLDPQLLPQPEGITFNRQGDLFIASEGKKKQAARLAVFRHTGKIPENPKPDGR